MAIKHVTIEDQQLLQEISGSLETARKIVVVTGAGISTSCGIPDFRSQNGLYSLINSGHNLRLKRGQAGKAQGIIKGKDLFDANLWKHEDSTSAFYTFIASLRQRIKYETRGTSATHKFIRRLRNEKKLVRCYTQNIDGLEEREGLCNDLSRGRGSRSRFTKKSLNLPDPELHNVPGGRLEGGCEVVQLHGDLETLRCTICRHNASWDATQEEQLLQGEAPVCPSCAQQDDSRRDRGKRGSAIGTLRPNVVLYGEGNPASESISSIVAQDLRFGPDLLLVLGTSLKVHGLKSLVKEFAKAVHSKKNGKVIFVNLSSPAESVWNSTIDYWVDMECDRWTRNKFRAKQSQILFKPNKSRTVISKTIRPMENKENIEELSDTSRNVKKEVINISPIKAQRDGLPTPPPSRRKALSDVAPQTNSTSLFTTNTRNTRSEVYGTPSKRNEGRSASEANSITLSSPPRGPVVPITPRSSGCTPRKRRKLQEEFTIWDGEDEGVGASQPGIEDPLLEIMNPPLGRGKKRKLM